MIHRCILALITLNFLTAMACPAPASTPAPEYAPQNGDVIFQTSQSTQGPAIQLATESPYSHVGIIYIKNGVPGVFEASAVVRFTPLDKWITGGDGGWYTVKRLKNASKVLTPEVSARLRIAGNRFLGRSYDSHFQWSDNKIYCSELVWKVYHEGMDLELTPLRTMGEYMLDDSRVQKLIEKRWGSSFDPDEPVIAPGDLDMSPMLETVYSNY